MAARRTSVREAPTPHYRYIPSCILAMYSLHGRPLWPRFSGKWERHVISKRQFRTAIANRRGFGATAAYVHWTRVNAYRRIPFEYRILEALTLVILFFLCNGPMRRGRSFTLWIKVNCPERAAAALVSCSSKFFPRGVFSLYFYVIKSEHLLKILNKSRNNDAA